MLKVVGEIGIDISGQRLKRIDEHRGTLFDLAVTVCDKAKEICPIYSVSFTATVTALSAIKTIYKTFRDPATAEGSEKEQIAVFREVETR